MAKLDKNRFGLILGVFFALFHAVWALIVAIIPNGLQSFLDWVFALHFIQPIWIITAFNLSNALILVALTFVFGYIFGWVFAAIVNWILKR